MDKKIRLVLIKLFQNLTEIGFGSSPQHCAELCLERSDVLCFVIGALTISDDDEIMLWLKNCDSEISTRIKEVCMDLVQADLRMYSKEVH